MFVKLGAELGTKLAEKALLGMAEALGGIVVTMSVKNAMKAKEQKATAKEETKKK